MYVVDADGVVVTVEGKFEVASWYAVVDVHGHVVVVHDVVVDARDDSSCCSAAVKCALEFVCRDFSGECGDVGL